jgi:hypothetical protein
VKVIAWNIQSFTLRRVNDNGGATVTERAAASERTLAVTMYIVTTVEDVDADAFVVLEARSAQGPFMELATGNGPQGLLYLLAQLREWISPAWCLVPPLRVNPPDPLAVATHTETVGVFYRSDRLTFTGPIRWPAANNATGPPILPGGAATAPYPAPWAGAVPPGTVAAAICSFNNAAGTAEELFTGPLHRRPHLTTFTEINAPARTINLWSVHFKPGVTAQTANARLADLVNRVPPAQVQLVVGDFNLDLINPTLVAGATLGLWAPPFSNFARIPAGPGAPTMIEQNVNATPGNYARNLSYDFGFVRYAGGGVAVPGGPIARVIDRVAGTPAAPPLPALTSDMAQPLATIAGIVNPVDQLAAFRSRWNYGHISPPNPGTSDHLPVMFEV